MPNIKYTVYGKNIIVTTEEHTSIMRAKEAGQTMIVLRNGTLGIPLTTNWLFMETTEPTATQEESPKPFNLMSEQLPGGREFNQDERKKSTQRIVSWAIENGLYKRVKSF